jgi:hypothetical protein
MDTKDCKSYEGCGAPICPMDDATRDVAQWYPDEEICGLREFRKEKWRIAQRKIAKKATNTDTYFTMPMLNAVGMVCKGIKGAKPDNPIEVAEVRQATFLKERLGGTPQPIKSDDGMPSVALK